MSVVKLQENDKAQKLDGKINTCRSGTWPMKGSKAAGDLVLIQTTLFHHVNRVLMLTSLDFHEISKEV